MAPASAETDPSVCYRHPDRTSWTLCSRCGRTICPECQILTPHGVRCPDCVQETGGSVTWQSTSAPRTSARASAPKRRARAERVSSSGEGWSGRLGQMLRPGSDIPIVTWTVVGLAVALYIVTLVTGGFPQSVLGFSNASAPWEIWRFFTAPLVYPASFFISLLFNGLFLVLTGPMVEQRLGRSRSIVLVLAAAALGSASMLLAGFAPFGLSGVLFGVFGAYLIFVWDYPPARVQGLVIIGINLLVALFFGAVLLPQIVGGLIAGAGTAYLYGRYDDRRNSNPRTPNLIIGAVVAAFILFALLRLFAF